MLKFTTLVLAAGKGTRMKSDLPKVLHKACGKPLLGYVLGATQAVGAEAQFVVLGHGRELVKEAMAAFSFTEIWQKEQRGTGHAVQTALPQLTGDTILILNGDGPLLQPDTLRAFLEAHKAKKADLTLGVMIPDSPSGYGRVLVGAGGKLKKIVEEKEANAKERAVRTVNGGIYAVSRKFLEFALPKLKASAKTGEIYLTDIVALGAAKKKKIFAYEMPAAELAGVNDFGQLAEVEEVLRKRQRAAWLKAGARLEVPHTVWAEHEVQVSQGAQIGPNVVIKGKSSIGAGAIVEAGCVLVDSVVESGAVIKAYSHLEGATVRSQASVGPFARLRPGTDLGEGAKVGNFVETKKAKFGKGAKANHLSYVGDAEIGAEANLGCGFIACNYDGVSKHKTTVGDRAFVGSGVRAVAPVKIGADSYVATGSTVNRDVPENALAIARAKQENKEGYAERLRSRMQAAKKAKGN